MVKSDHTALKRHSSQATLVERRYVQSMHAFTLIIPLTTALTLAGATASAEPKEKPFHLCYFSLNNEKEFKEMDKFLAKINKVSPRKITITEYVDPSKSQDAKTSFQNMIDSGANCDGLVISGHHTGSFGGSRTSGSLDVSFMEALSCDPKYEGWFRNIQSLWLQGCRTLGVGKIEATQENDEANSADFHTGRVGAVLQEDGLTQSFADLNMEFSATLDQDNPLSSRYLRVFPRATVFGWTKTAPGVKTRSEFSIPYHIAHIARLNDDRKRLFEDPCQVSQLSDKTAACYANVMTSLLNSSDRLNTSQKNCKNSAVQGWISHGNPQKGEYGFDNQDINAYEALEKVMDPDLAQAQKDDCKLKHMTNPAEIMKALDSVLRNQKSVGYGFNSVWEMMQKLKQSGSVQDLALLDQVQKKLKSNAELQTFLARKLASPQLGLLRKIDYYAFYRDLTGTKVDQVEKLILGGAKKQMATYPSENYDVRDYQETLIKSLGKNGFLNPSSLHELVSEVKNPNQIYRVASKAIAEGSHSSTEESSRTLQSIVLARRADSSALEGVADAVSLAKGPISGVSRILESIVQSPKANGRAVVEATNAIWKSKHEIPEAAALLGLALRSSAKFPSDEDDIAGSVAYVIGMSKFKIQNSHEILESVMQSRAAVQPRVLTAVIGAIGSSGFKISDDSRLLQKLIQSPRADAQVLKSAAEAIGSSKFEIQGAGKLLESIVASPLVDADGLSSVAHAVSQSKSKISEASALLETIARSPKAKSHTLATVATAVMTSQYPIEGGGRMLESAIRSRITDQRFMNTVAVTVGDPNSKLSDSERERFAKLIYDSPVTDDAVQFFLENRFPNLKKP